MRGAITVPVDSSEAIRDGTVEMVRAVLERNAVVADDIVSIVFTVTPDLRADFPAAAARQIGLSGVPLLCAQEIPVQGAMPRCIRLLMHCYAPAERPIRHVYLREARQLRMDLPE